MMNKQIETNQCGLFKLQQTVFHPLCGVAGAGDAHVRSATQKDCTRTSGTTKQHPV